MIPIDYSAHERMMKKYGRYLTNHFKPDATKEDEPRFCVEGLAILTNKPIETKDGEILIIESGAFDQHFASGAKTEIWLSHDESKVICSTASGAEFEVTAQGLAFRFPLDNRRYSDSVRRMVKDGKQASVSVGITHKKSRRETVAGRSVIFVECAELREVSLVAEGACQQAFARLVDANHAPSLKASIDSVPFKIDAAIHNIKRQAAKNQARFDALAKRLDALEATAPQTKRKWPSWAESNHMQSEETERLQQLARSRNIH